MSFSSHGKNEFITGLTGRLRRVPEPAQHLCNLLLLVLLAAALCYWSWLKWPHHLYDFGYSLYTPWQLSEGKVLYKDIDYLYGPFSQYFHAAIFSLFGAAYVNIIVANAVWMLLFVFFAYYLFQYYLDKMSATVCSAFFLIGFGFSQYMDIGNYNFMTPYTPEATHGVILSFLLVCFYTQYAETEKIWHMCLAGLSFGTIQLTKVEISFAAITVSIAFFTYLFFTRKRSRSTHVAGALCFLICALLVPAAFLAHFLFHMSPAPAFRAIAACWMPLFTTDMTDNIFFAHSSGADAMLANLIVTTRETIKILGVMSGFLFLSTHYHGWKINKTLSCLLIVSLALLLSFHFNVFSISRSLPLLAAGILMSSVYLELRRKKTRDEKNYICFIALMSVFSLSMLARIGLQARLHHYGFYAAMPASLLAVAFFLGYLPKASGIMRKNTGKPYRIAALLFVAGACLQMLQVSHHYYSKKTYLIGEGGDRFKTYSPAFSPVGPIYTQFLQWADRHLKPTDTFMVLPEGIILNYMSRHVNPSRHRDIMHLALTPNKSAEFLSDFKRNPPNYVILAHRSTAEFGKDFFGKDPGFGGNIWHWIQINYKQLILFGNDPLKRPDHFGLKVLIQRKKMQGLSI